MATGSDVASGSGSLEDTQTEERECIELMLQSDFVTRFQQMALLDHHKVWFLGRTRDFLLGADATYLDYSPLTPEEKWRFFETRDELLKRSGWVKRRKALIAATQKPDFVINALTSIGLQEFNKVFEKDGLGRADFMMQGKDELAEMGMDENQQKVYLALREEFAMLIGGWDAVWRLVDQWVNEDEEEAELKWDGDKFLG